MAKNTSEEKTFEQSLGELQNIVEELQSGDIPLERTVTLYRKGVTLRRECQERLTEVERLIETLGRDEAGQPVARDYSQPEANQDDQSTVGDDDIPF
ncbi:MAG TPA: exodeoxyribonuclease VII small subunit [Pyrinomonadaceae bacterium]|nr:exodeoxyribonuclease VII small subunit [Pyrinomonadaceae bacterium]